LIKYLLLIITVVFISCTTIRYNRQEVYLKEISRYNLKNGDTLVDIGCETGFHDNQIAYYYPDLFFVLEDIDANNLEQIKKNNANPQFVNPMKAGYELVLGTADTIPLQQASYKKIPVK
jgi:ubiquinone/menaquinone biosynthesis C-methylase UbiE